MYRHIEPGPSPDPEKIAEDKRIRDEANRKTRGIISRNLAEIKGKKEKERRARETPTVIDGSFGNPQNKQSSPTTPEAEETRKSLRRYKKDAVAHARFIEGTLPERDRD